MGTRYSASSVSITVPQYAFYCNINKIITIFIFKLVQICKFCTLRQKDDMSATSLFGLDACRVWDTDLAFQHLNDMGEAETKRTAERRLHELGILPAELGTSTLEDELGRRPIASVLNWELAEARSKRKLVLFAQLFELSEGKICLHANDGRGARYWVPLGTTKPESKEILDSLQNLQQHIGKDIAVFPHGRLTTACRSTPSSKQVCLSLLSYLPVLNPYEQNFVAENNFVHNTSPQTTRGGKHPYHSRSRCRSRESRHALLRRQG